MDENKIEKVDELEEEEYMPTEVIENSNGGLMVAVGVGIAALAGLGYKFVVKPLWAKHKAKKESQANVIDITETVNVEDSESKEEPEEE